MMPAAVDAVRAQRSNVQTFDVLTFPADKRMGEIAEGGPR